MILYNLIYIHKIYDIHNLISLYVNSPFCFILWTRHYRTRIGRRNRSLTLRSAVEIGKEDLVRERLQLQFSLELKCNKTALTMLMADSCSVDNVLSVLDIRGER